MTNDQNEQPAMDEEAAVVDPEIMPDTTASAEDGNQTDDEGSDIESLLSQSEAKAAEYLDGWQRARAELANAKKRMDRERGQLKDMVMADVVLRLLPVVDDLDLAIENLPDDLSTNEWVDGIRLIHRKLSENLTELGLSEIEAVGTPFDPERHEAVMQVQQEGHDAGTVVAVMRKGYQLEDKVIRPAMVQVAG